MQEDIFLCYTRCILSRLELMRSFSRFKKGTSTVRQMAKAIKKTIKIAPK